MAHKHIPRNECKAESKKKKAKSEKKKRLLGMSGRLKVDSLEWNKLRAYWVVAAVCSKVCMFV
jgi:hypothetical protein